MPMLPETVVAMLACARIGAIHSVVFGGFSPDSLANRINDSDCSIIVYEVTAKIGAGGMGEVSSVALQGMVSRPSTCQVPATPSTTCAGGA